MRAALDPLPDDVDGLRALVRAQQAQLRARDELIALLRAQLATLRRQRFGRSSEKLDRQIADLEQALEDIEASGVSPSADVETDDTEPTVAPSGEDEQANKPVRGPLPSHLPREEMEHPVGDTCPDCGGALGDLGTDVTEILDYVPGRFRVIRHVRRKKTCRCCERIAQAPAPSLPIRRGRASPALLAHILLAKYGQHLPLYRQSEAFAREGVDLARSTLAGWIGQVVRLLRPLLEALERYVLAADKLHGDDTPVPVLDPGRGKTKTGRLWVYVRDDRASGSSAPPAVLYCYSPDRRGAHPQTFGDVQGRATGGWLRGLQRVVSAKGWRSTECGRSGLLGARAAQVL